jgi:hypothetical protein
MLKAAESAGALVEPAQLALPDAQESFVAYRGLKYLEIVGDVLRPADPRDQDRQTTARS